ncbi:MAG TPA: hypothetical protein PK644_02015, partial [bacterium]|nr:hypothetical protein [bacterium]
GGLMRNLMGATTNDSHIQRLWGTLGAAEIIPEVGLQLRLGGSGGSPKLVVNPAWDELGELAARTGHGGGDFWVLYYFARQILTGQPAPFDIYAAADVTIPEILAFRSARENGKAYDVPDFRDKKQRDLWRHDTWAQQPYDVKSGVFPPDADRCLTGQFTTVMRDLIDASLQCRAYFDWGKVKKDLAEPEKYQEIVKKTAAQADSIVETYRKARRMVDAYPESDGARVLREMLELGKEEVVTSPSFLRKLKRQLHRPGRRKNRQ